jgi:protein-L-isoaspartate(D-aspartate) O-methyltransferase
MPVGHKQRRQRMVKVTKLANGRFRRQNLGPVAFVPLIGKQGWESKDS